MGRLSFGIAAAVAAVLCGGCVAAGAPPDPPDLAAGERVYARCLACHALAAGEDDRDGPTLHAIVGRSVAAVPGYAYSPALRAYAKRQPRWTPEALDAFLADPQAVAPGNTMGFFGLRNAAERAALITWLTLEPEPRE